MPTTPITLTSPLPDGDLMFDSMSYASGLSMLEELQLNLLSEKADIEPDKLLGQTVNLKIELRDGEQRHICGYVARFGMGRHQGRYHGYRAEVVPWLWFLTRTADCRIFQEMTVPEIVEKVFADHDAIASYELKLTGSYRKRDYCVQYRETDFNFVSRLMEEEGIYWYFEHDEGAHKLIIVDETSAHAAMPGYEKLPYYANTGQLSPDVDFISNWSFSRGVRTGKVVLRSYNFETPSTNLEVSRNFGRGHDQAEHEQFDYQGDYLKKPEGQHLADMRIDELQTRHEQLGGISNAYGLASGHLFTLTRHPREDQNAEYLCVQAQVSAQVNGLEAGNDAGDYQCSFAAIPSGQQFRPPRRTPKPFVQGPQTAIVVGPAGEEIFTDKYGRVKVQFHWDRLGKKNETSSCWMRVSSPWAGKSFGFIQIPRIGQEVVVDFLEGDPDQPLITGRVYNAEQMPPWELPANMTQSGVLTRSSKGGAYGNANALRFEDKKGDEQVWLHAEKNQDIEVENDETHWVGHDRTKTIDHDETVHVKHDRTETVDNDETITVHHDRKERVDNDETISIGRDRTMVIERDKSEKVERNKKLHIVGNHSENIDGAMSVVIGKTLTETVLINYAETVGGAMELTVGAALAITVGAAMSENVAGTKSESIGGSKTESIGSNKTQSVGKSLTESVKENQTVTVGKDLNETIEGQHRVEVKKDATLKAKKVQITADDEISFKTGSAEIVMKKNGDITIKGNKITVKGSGDVIVKGSKIAEN
ncbi:type VI secretion system tip protein VgrG [Aquincola sp. S2]|uniref:Type VI secretion system tip protein VgrG n=2 Tax=Pseudaquabacterium terrae TaxID=2732868 RepID=A0ABX2ECR1_9BURK|nr:type VI secretion system tip protein VgrG [Aquabacterium terrae]